MTRVVLIGLPGDASVWMVDLDRKTVSEIPQEAAAKMADGPRPMIKGVDFAVAVPQDAQVAAGKFDTVELSSLA